MQTGQCLLPNLPRSLSHTHTVHPPQPPTPHRLISQHQPLHCLLFALFWALHNLHPELGLAAFGAFGLSLPPVSEDSASLARPPALLRLCLPAVLTVTAKKSGATPPLVGCCVVTYVNVFVVWVGVGVGAGAGAGVGAATYFKNWRLLR